MRGLAWRSSLFLPRPSYSVSGGFTELRLAITYRLRSSRRRKKNNRRLSGTAEVLQQALFCLSRVLFDIETMRRPGSGSVMFLSPIVYDDAALTHTLDWTSTRCALCSVKAGLCVRYRSLLWLPMLLRTATSCSKWLTNLRVHVGLNPIGFA